MNLNEAISTIRVELQETNIKKSGKNKFAGFDYFELADFLPTLNKLMNKYQVNDQMTIKDGYATLSLIKGEEKQEYSIPFIQFETPLNKQGLKSMQDIQYLGALNTYYKRYLYLNAFGITDGEVIDAMDNSDTSNENKPKDKKATKKSIEEVIKDLKNADFMATATNTIAILKELGIKNVNDLNNATESVITNIKGAIVKDIGVAEQNKLTEQEKAGIY